MHEAGGDTGQFRLIDGNIETSHNPVMTIFFMISEPMTKKSTYRPAGADVSTINEAVSQRIKQFRSQKDVAG